MAYTSPPNVSAGSFTTGAANTVTANRGLISAPGVGQALRVVYLHFASFRNNTGKINVLVHDGAGGTTMFRGAMPIGDSDGLNVVEPGIQLPSQSGLQVDDISDIAAQSYYFVVHYYIDKMT